MNPEKLDKKNLSNSNNRTQHFRIVLLSIFTIILFFIFEIIRIHIPENLIQWKGLKIKWLGLLIIGIVIINSIQIPKFLNQLRHPTQ